MADKETGLNIPISTYADEKSVKIAMKDLTKDVLRSLKDGYIEVPAEIKTSFARGSKELDKAQKDVIAQWEKMSKKGFSSSGKELDELVEKYKRFKSLAGKEGKANSKQSKWLTNTIGELLQPYIKQKKDLDAILDGFKASVTKIDKTMKTSVKKSTRKSTKKDKPINWDQAHELIDTVEKQKEYGIGKKTSAPTHESKATQRSLYLSHRGGAYESNMLRQALIAEREQRRKNKHTYKQYNDKEMAKKSKKEALKKKPLTPQEEARGISKAATDSIMTLMQDLLKGDTSVSLEKFEDVFRTVYRLDRKSGAKLFDTVNKELNAALGSFFSASGYIGIGYDRDKIEESKIPEIEAVLKSLLDTIAKMESDIIKELMELEKNDEWASKQSRKKLNNTELQRAIQETKRILAEVTSGLTNIEADTELQKDKLERTYMQDIRESSRESMADEKEETNTKSSSESEADSLDQLKELGTQGFNNDATTDSLIRTINSIFAKTEIFDSILAKMTVFDDITSVLSNMHKALENISSILDIVQKKGITINGGKGSKGSKKKKDEYTPDPRRLPVPYDPAVGGPIDDPRKFEAAYKKKETAFNKKDVVEAVEKELALFETGEHPSQQRPEFSQTAIVTYRKGILGLFDKIAKNLSPMTEVDRIMALNAEERAQARAARIEMFGENRGKSLMDTGDKASVRRVKQLFGWIYNRDSANKELFQDIKITPGLGEIDTTKIGYAINKVLSGSEMFKAQTGGTLRNLIGSMTGYIGMPSLEKSRTQAEGLNQIMANVRTEVLALLQDVKSKEMALQGMIDMGTAKFKKDGTIDMEASSTGAQKIFTDLEEQKGVLKEALAEVQMIDEVIARSGGKVSKIMKQIGFVMPELLQNNTILQNINAGLDKNGKALKFQSRMGETLNYSFQLLSRHIGQIVKNWMMQLNPMIQIKKLYDDFVSYNPKWQRTMNVVKYNLRDIILPIMDKMAQLLVNMIGFVDIILQKVQAAFGITPISLFDQENAKKYKDEVEEIQNVTAGFDELHDIGSDSDKDPNNLLGDIYKPELSQEWIDLAERIGNLFAGIIKGDLGFGDVMKEILGIAWQGIKTLWDEIIKPFVTNTLWPWLKESWLEILAWVAGAFLSWSFLKWAGNALWNAIFGMFTLGNITGLFSAVGGWISGLLGSAGFGGGILTAFQTLFAGGKYSLIGTLGEMFTNSAAITQAGSWGSMIGFALTKGLLAAVTTAFTVGAIVEGVDNGLSTGAYNKGLMEAGGKEEDKKSNAGNVLGTTLKGVAGGAATGALIGGLPGAAIGAAIGGIASLLTSALAPAFAGVEMAARNANNEMQRLEYYEGVVQGASTEATEFASLLQLSNQAIQAQTDKVYALGAEYGVSTDTLNTLIASMKEGNFTSEMTVGLNSELVGALTQLDWHYANNKDVTDKLTAAKKKLQKAEMDLAIAEDVAAGNFELAAARIEVALASELYETDEATQKMTQVIKEASAEQAAEILHDLSPDMKKNFNSYYDITKGNMDELTKLYFGYKEDEREAFLQNLTPEIERQMRDRVNAIKREVENAPWYMRLLDVGNDGKIFGISYVDVSGYATGTNYVPNDGLAYLHQGEAVIPKKYNQPYQPQSMSPEEQAYMNTMLNTMKSLDSTMKQGITVNGQFVQRGSDLVAVVNKTKSQTGADLLSNVAYAR